MAPLAVPGEYGAWTDWLDAFGRGEDPSVEHLPAVDEAMGPHMQSRVVERVARAFEARAALWARVLQRDLAAATADPMSVAAAMVSARRRLGPLLALAGDSRLPPAVREELRSGLESLVTSAQESLQDSARRTVDDTVLRAAVRDNDLRRALAAPPAMPPAPAVPRSAAAAPRGRRVIV